MHEKQAVFAIVAGAVLAMFGLVPGLTSRLMFEIQNFADSLSNSSARRAVYSSTDSEHVPGQVWLAVAGLALVALAIYSIVGN
ncbi:MAG: hypothetical protein JWN34_2799 [Bryobacterales bacterium]|nr:hypothetical protein [Bryobacterales bacterium]